MHWFIDPVKEHYADFEGRVARKDYWMFVLVYILLSIVMSIIASIIHVKVLLTLFYLVILIPSVAIATRRLHDINKSGWWQLIALIPLVGWIILIVWLASKGDESSNTYGEALVSVSPESTQEGAPATPSIETEAPVENKETTTEESSKEETEERTN